MSTLIVIYIRDNFVYHHFISHCLIPLDPWNERADVHCSRSLSKIDNNIFLTQKSHKFDKNNINIIKYRHYVELFQKSFIELLRPPAGIRQRKEVSHNNFNLYHKYEESLKGRTSMYNYVRIYMSLLYWMAIYFY